MRFGDAMQNFLRQSLINRRKRYLEPGEIVVAPSCGSPFSGVVHAVAIDGFYDTTTEIIRSAYAEAIQAITDRGFRTVASSCLACGYGRATAGMFVDAIRGFLHQDFPSLEQLTFFSTNDELIDAIRRSIASSRR